jgi:hypothetical protein
MASAIPVVAASLPQTQYRPLSAAFEARKPRKLPLFLALPGFFVPDTDLRKRACEARVLPATVGKVTYATWLPEA